MDQQRRLPGSALAHYLPGRPVFALWIVVVVAVCVRVAASPHRQSVYAADYAPAARHWLHGQEIYQAKQRFIYSPLAAAILVPFAALPDRVGGIVWRLVCTAGLLWAASAWTHGGLAAIDGLPPSCAGPPSLTWTWLWLLPLVAGNINLGQMNLVVLACVAGSVLAASQGRWNTAALLIAATAYLKIYPLAVGGLLAILYPRKMAGRLVLALAALGMISFGLQRPAYVWGEYGRWFATLNNDDRLDADLYATWRDFGFLWRACGLPLSNQTYRVVEAAAGMIVAAFLWCGQRRWRWTERRLLGATFALGCVWMLLFGPATEAATYAVLSLPVCATLLCAWRLPSATGRWGLAAAFACSYALLVLADVLNAWLHGVTHHLYMRALQPVAALIYAAAAGWWAWRGPSFHPFSTEPRQDEQTVMIASLNRSVSNR